MHTYLGSLFDTLSTTSSTWRPSNFGQMPPFKWTENHITLLKVPPLPLGFSV